MRKKTGGREGSTGDKRRAKESEMETPGVIRSLRTFRIQEYAFQYTKFVQIEAPPRGERCIISRISEEDFVSQ